MCFKTVTCEKILKYSWNTANSSAVLKRRNHAIRSVKCPTVRIAWFLNDILVQLLKYTSYRLTDTQTSDHFQALQINSACVIESFDVEFLYTNITAPRCHGRNHAIRSVKCPTVRIAWFLNDILVQLLKYTSYRLTDTQTSDHFQALQINSACVIESFDVEFLYTNVSNVSAMEAILELPSQHQGKNNMHVSQLMGQGMPQL
ncbi:hypothetical protein COOONC_06792 [Cooperia oncophora]